MAGGFGVRTIAIYALISVVCWASYYNSLWGDFVFDDYVACVENKDVMPDVPLEKVFVSDFWGTKIDDWQSHKSYRPLTVLSFRLSYMMAGERFTSFYFHVVNVIGHNIVSILTFHVALIALGSGSPETRWSSCPTSSFSIAATTALFYASHPIHTDAVSSVVSRSEVLSALFFMLSFLVYTKGARPGWTWFGWFWIVLSMVFAFTALLFKELGFTVIGLNIGHDLFRVCGVLPRLRAWWTRKKVIVPAEDPKEKDEDKGETDSEIPAAAPLEGGPELRQRKGKKEPAKPHDKIIEKEPTKPAEEEKEWPRVNHVWAVVRILFVLGSSAAIGYWRIAMNNGVPNFKQVENPAMFETEFVTRALTYNFLLVLNARQLVYPVTLMADYSNTVVPLVKELEDPRNGLTAALWVTLLALIIACIRLASLRRTALMMSLGFLIIPFFPSTNCLFPVGFVVAERVLYIPSLGFCMLLALALDALRSKFRIPFAVYSSVVLTIIGLYTYRCYLRNFDWENQPNFWSAMMRDYPDSAKGHFGYANLLSRDPRRVDEAIAMLHKSAELFPQFWDAYNNLAGEYQKRGQLERAAEMFKFCYDIHPVRYESQYNLALSHHNLGKYEDAFLAFDSMVEYFPTNTDLYAKMGMTLHALKMYEDELDALKTITELEPRHPYHLFAYGKLAAQLGQMDEAEKSFRAAIVVEGNYFDALYNLGGLLTEKGKMKEAHALFQRVAQLAPYMPRLAELIDMTFDATGSSDSDAEAEENFPGENETKETFGEDVPSSTLGSTPPFEEDYQPGEFDDEEAQIQEQLRQQRLREQELGPDDW